MLWTSQYYSQDEEKHDSNIGFGVFFSSWMSRSNAMIPQFIPVPICVYILFIYIFLCIHVSYLYQTSTCIKSPIFLGSQSPIWMSPSKKTPLRRKRLEHLNDLVNLELTMFLQRCGLQNHLKPIRLQPGCDHTIPQPTVAPGPC